MQAEAKAERVAAEEEEEELELVDEECRRERTGVVSSKFSSDRKLERLGCSFWRLVGVEDEEEVLGFLAVADLCCSEVGEEGLVPEAERLRLAEVAFAGFETAEEEVEEVERVEVEPVLGEADSVRSKEGGC